MMKNKMLIDSSKRNMTYSSAADSKTSNICLMAEKCLTALVIRKTRKIRSTRKADVVLRSPRVEMGKNSIEDEATMRKTKTFLKKAKCDDKRLEKGNPEN